VTIAAFLTEQQVADRWHLSTRFVRQVRKERRIDCVMFGRCPRYPIEAVELYEREQLVEARTVTMKRRRA